MLKSGMDVLAPIWSLINHTTGNDLKKTAVLTLDALQGDDNVKKYVREMWTEGLDAVENAPIERVSHILFSAQAKAYLPDNEADSATLTSVYIEGSCALILDRPFETIALIVRLPLADCRKFYKQAAGIILHNQKIATQKKD